MQKIRKGPPAIRELEQSLSVLLHLVSGSGTVIVGWKIKHISTKYEPTNKSLSIEIEKVMALTNPSE